MTQPAVIYARFSSMEQGKGFSLERQIGQGKAYVEQQGWSLKEVLTDEGKSAYSGANRLVGSSLFGFEASAREGKQRGTVLCVENIDRLSRQGAKAAAKLIWSLNESGVDVATWNDGYVYRSGSDSDLMELFSVIIKAQMAYEESLKKSQRTAASWAKRYKDIEDGIHKPHRGVAPAWIEVRDDKYHLIPHRAKVINEIFDNYIAGIGTYKIVQMLNERKEPLWHVQKSAKDNGWYLAYVHRILTRRTVLGEYVNLKGETVATDHFPQVVTAEKFEKAQVVRGGKRSTGGGNRTRINNLLSTLIYCGTCGGRAGYENKGQPKLVQYVGKTGKPREFQRRHYERFRCDNNRRSHKCENSAVFEYKMVEGAVLDRVLALALDDDAENPRLLALRSEIAETERLRAHAVTRLDNLVDALADGGSKTLMTRISGLESEIEEHDKRIKQLEEDAQQQVHSTGTEDDLVMIESLRSDLNSPDYDVRFYARSQTNQALKRVLEKVIIDADGTFSVWATDTAVWTFDSEGNVIAGQAL